MLRAAELKGEENAARNISDLLLKIYLRLEALETDAAAPETPQLPVTSATPDYLTVNQTDEAQEISFHPTEIFLYVPVFTQFANSATAPGDTFMQPGSSDLATGAVEVLYPVPSGLGQMSISGFSIAVVDAAGWAAATGSVKFTLRVDGVDTLQVLTLTPPALFASSNSSVVIFGGGQTLSIKVSDNTLSQEAAFPVLVLYGLAITGANP